MDWGLQLVSDSTFEMTGK